MHFEHPFHGTCNFNHFHVCTLLADVMVPSLERAEFMDELRAVADNIVRERLEHAEVHPIAHAAPTADVTSCDVIQQSPKSPASIGTLGKAYGSEDVQRPLEAPSQADARHSPLPHGVEPVGPAFHIPMTQSKSLEELPSQLDFEWQDAVSPNSTPAHITTRNLGGELDVAGTSRPAAESDGADVGAFVEVSQIAQEAVQDAIQQPPSQEPHYCYTGEDGIGDASQV